jgi:aminoglycoside 6'-N-acetyltransferase
VEETRARARATSPLEGDGVVVRLATESDADMLVAWHTDPDVSRFWDGKLFDRESMLERLRRPHVDPYIVESDGAPAGYLQVWFDPDDETGIDMFLIPASRGKGIGPAAARTLVAHLLRAGRTRVTVDPYQWNTTAIRAWERSGFRRIDKRPADEEHTAPWVLMEFDPAPRD